MTEKQKLYNSIFLPFLFTVIIWFIKVGEYFSDSSFAFLGIKPRNSFGLLGIIFSPFLHGDFSHILANTVPFLILSSGIFYFYRKIAFKVIGLMWLLSGLGVWIMGRSSYHIGASGLIYAFTTFLFFSGILRKHKPLIAISLLIAFLYGSIVWGILPQGGNVSWEGHLMGFIAGITTAVFYKQKGPQRKKYDWELEYEKELDIECTEDTTALKDYDFNYFYKENTDL